MDCVWSAGWSELQPAHGCPKHVEKRNKYTKQNCAPSWIYLQDKNFRCKTGKVAGYTHTHAHARTHTHKGGRV